MLLQAVFSYAADHVIGVVAVDLRSLPFPRRSERGVVVVLMNVSGADPHAALRVYGEQVVPKLKTG